MLIRYCIRRKSSLQENRVHLVSNRYKILLFLARRSSITLLKEKGQLFEVLALIMKLESTKIVSMSTEDKAKNVMAVEGLSIR